MNNINNKENMMMDWNDAIENDGQEFVLLPEGDYNFVVTNFERGRFPGGPKIPACNKATITVQISAKEGVSVVKFDLFLYRSVEWRISAFFRCIGQKKSGEKLVMNWNNVIGSKGRAHFKQRTYTNTYGEDKTINDLTNFIDYKPEFFTQESNSHLAEVRDDDLPF
ncbi:MAG TPA: hypothetical protein PLA71_05070 [Saccharofermentans sp.]|nr:hypothetical protein [Saccharofermentans sp.]